MFKNILKIHVLLVVLLTYSCKPTDIEITLYTSDIDEVKNDKLINLPVTITFSSIAEDKNNLFERASIVAKEYASSDSEFAISQGNYSKNLVVKTKLPFGKYEVLKEYLSNNKRVAYLALDKDNEITRLTFRSSKSLEELNKKLANVEPLTRS